MTPAADHRVHDSFRRSLPTYGQEASPQRRIANLLVRRFLRVCPLRHFHSLFEFGCGTGHLTRPLLQEVDCDHVVLNDLVEQVPADLPILPNRFLAGDIETIEWPSSVDLIASASALQWIEGPDALVRRLAGHLEVGGWMALSTFGTDQFLELQALGSVAGAPGYMDADRLKAAMSDRLSLLDSGESRLCLWFDSPVDVLRHLRRTGVNGRATGQWTRRDLARFSDQYSRRFAQGGRVPLTYHPVWGIGTKV